MSDGPRCRWCGSAPADCAIQPRCDDACDGRHSFTVEFVGGPWDGLHYAVPVAAWEHRQDVLLQVGRKWMAWVDRDAPPGPFPRYQLEVVSGDVALVLRASP